MDNLDRAINELLAQEQASKKLRYKLHNENIKRLLADVGYSELIEMIDAIHSEQFAKDEIATARTMQ
ncbi:hypothetical protein ACWA5Z_06535 [Testudinibacter sp. P80/BLE/0925]